MIKRNSFKELKQEDILRLFNPKDQNYIWDKKVLKLILKVKEEYEKEHDITINQNSLDDNIQKDADRSISGIHKQFIQRVIAEYNTENDLKKSIEQLICDVHEETHNDAISKYDRLLNSQKRMVSMMGRVAISNEKYSKKIECLTIVMAVFSFFTLVFTLIQLFNIKICF
jgi:hypothetical protein